MKEYVGILTLLATEWKQYFYLISLLVFRVREEVQTLVIYTDTYRVEPVTGLVKCTVGAILVIT